MPDVLHCNQCESDWKKRVKAGLPVQCPRCKRVDWAEPKKGERSVELSRPPKVLDLGNSASDAGGSAEDGSTSYGERGDLLHHGRGADSVHRIISGSKEQIVEPSTPVSAGRRSSLATVSSQTRGANAGSGAPVDLRAGAGAERVYESGLGESVLAHGPICEDIAIPSCTECDEPLREAKGKWACVDQGCALYGREQKSKEN